MGNLVRIFVRLVVRYLRRIKYLNTETKLVGIKPRLEARLTSLRTSRNNVLFILRDIYDSQAL
jgi:hypothetical protein